MQSRFLPALRGMSLRSLPQFKLRMPGRCHRGPLPPLTAAQAALAIELRATVEKLAGEIVHRNVFNPAGYAAAELFLGESLARMGYRVRRQGYIVQGVECANLDVQLVGTERPDQVVVIGAHYDSVWTANGGSPGANDNGSGVATTLALARMFADAKPRRTLRFAFFANEEPPFFWTEEMGSLVYAKACKARREKIVAMLTPETLGYYSDEPGSQRYPIPVARCYGDIGDFVAFVGMHESARLIRRVVGAFREHAAFPSLGAGLPSMVPMVGASDHWSFWRMGYPSLMITDTAPFRYPHYHKKTDTPDKIDYEKVARVVEGLREVISDLVDGQ